MAKWRRHWWGPEHTIDYRKEYDRKDQTQSPRSQRLRAVRRKARQDIEPLQTMGDTYHPGAADPGVRDRKTNHEHPSNGCPRVDRENSAKRYHDNAGDQPNGVGLGALPRSASHLRKRPEGDATKGGERRHLGVIKYVQAEVKRRAGGESHPNSAFYGNKARIFGLKPFA